MGYTTSMHSVTKASNVYADAEKSGGRYFITVYIPGYDDHTFMINFMLKDNRLELYWKDKKYLHGFKPMDCTGLDIEDVLVRVMKRIEDDDDWHDVTCYSCRWMVPHD